MVAYSSLIVTFITVGTSTCVCTACTSRCSHVVSVVHKTAKETPSTPPRNREERAYCWRETGRRRSNPPRNRKERAYCGRVKGGEGAPLRGTEKSGPTAGKSRYVCTACTSRCVCACSIVHKTVKETPSTPPRNREERAYCWHKTRRRRSNPPRNRKERAYCGRVKGGEGAPLRGTRMSTSAWRALEHMCCISRIVGSR